MKFQKFGPNVFYLVFTFYHKVVRESEWYIKKELLWHRHWPLRCSSKPLLCFSAHLWRQTWPARKTNKQKIKLVHWQRERSRLFLVCLLRIRKSTLMKKMALEWDTVHGALVYSCLTCLSATDLWHVETMAVCVKSLALHPLDTVYC